MRPLVALLTAVLTLATCTSATAQPMAPTLCDCTHVVARFDDVLLLEDEMWIAEFTAPAPGFFAVQVFQHAELEPGDWWLTSLHDETVGAVQCAGLACRVLVAPTWPASISGPRDHVVVLVVSP